VLHFGCCRRADAVRGRRLFQIPDSLGNSIEPLVVGVGVLIEQGVDTAKLVGLKGGSYEEHYHQIATPKTKASPPSTLGDDGQQDAVSMPSWCDIDGGSKVCVGLHAPHYSTRSSVTEGSMSKALWMSEVDRGSCSQILILLGSTATRRTRLC